MIFDFRHGLYDIIIMAFTNRDLFTRIISIIQIFTAIIITGVGIGITVKFRQIHHENGTPYEQALEYINNPWTTVYAAGVWMGLIVSTFVCSFHLGVLNKACSFEFRT